MAAETDARLANRILRSLVYGAVAGVVVLLLAFFVLQVSSIWVRNQADEFDSYLVDSVGEGLSVASWVMLWFPLQLATMEVWRAIIRRRRMRVIERVRVRVVPAEPTPEP